MKINLEFDDNDAIFEMMDAMFVAYLKNFRKDCVDYIGTAWMKEDKQAYKKLLKSCDVILEHYGVRDVSDH